MIYPQKLNSKKSDRILKGAILISVLVAFLLVTINRLTNPKIPWAALANGGIVYIWITVFYSIRKNINIAGHVLLQTVAISTLLLFIDYELGEKGWSVNMAIPIIIIISNITMLVLTIVSYKKFIKYAIYQLMIVLYSMLPILLMTENMIQDKMLSMIASGISIFNLFITFVLCAKDVKEAMIRKFHM
ncbi:MAG: hypothetical protein HFJ37_00290 [Clostridia bacterium]|nr:hypothetical protein [Clostridia bacterium]